MYAPILKIDSLEQLGERIPGSPFVNSGRLSEVETCSQPGNREKKGIHRSRGDWSMPRKSSAFFPYSTGA